jgi:hypothetical protein
VEQAGTASGYVEMDPALKALLSTTSPTNRTDKVGYVAQQADSENLNRPGFDAASYFVEDETHVEANGRNSSPGRDRGSNPQPNAR